MRLVTGCFLLLSASACTQEEPPTFLPDKVVVSPHLDGLSSSAQRRFLDGLSDFLEVETTATGLGPLFNAASCSHCHTAGGVGGAGTFRVLRAVCKDDDGSFYAPPSGTLIQLSVTRPDIVAPGIPWDCEPVVTQRRTTTVLGAGLLEAIADADIERTAREQPEAIRGRAAHIEDAITHQPRVGRLGWKAQHATLDAFAADAYRNEMGITNQTFPDEVAPHGDAQLLALMDQIPDPEANESGVGLLADFMRFSAAPRAPDASVPGHAVFERIGCEGCHKASYQASSAEPSIDGRTVRAFTDLLLHDVGTGPDIAQADASASELRTPPLWGLAETPLYLHDGRAATLDEAIRAHKGQATSASDAYLTLSAADKSALIDFLRGR